MVQPVIMVWSITFTLTERLRVMREAISYVFDTFKVASVINSDLL